MRKYKILGDGHFKPVNTLFQNHKQWERNVVLGWADVSGEGRIPAPLETPGWEAIWRSA